jgi:hypothetical protein
MRAFAGQTIRSLKLLARDSRIPRPLRWVAGLALLPIPGPVDEVILLLIAPVFFTFYREPIREAWRQADAPADSDQALKAAGLRE